MSEKRAYHTYTGAELRDLPYGDLDGAVIQFWIDGKPGAELLHLTEDEYIKTTRFGEGDTAVYGYFGSISPRFGPDELAAAGLIRVVRLHNRPAQPVDGVEETE